MKVSDIYYTNNGTKMRIVSMSRWDKIEVEFIGLVRPVENRFVEKRNILKGSVKTPYCRSVFGVGYLGEGPYKVSYKDRNGKIQLTAEYLKWSGILKRCYDETYLRNNPSYEQAYVCNDWHNFQFFAEWCQTQEGFGEEGWEIDKDLHVNSCKLYSPDYCSFVPKSLNIAGVAKNSRKDSKYIRGVYKYKNRYRANLSCFGEYESLGYYVTEEEAYNAYCVGFYKLLDKTIDRYTSLVAPHVIEYLKSIKLRSYLEEKLHMLPKKED